MNWKLIFLLSLFGLFMAVATVYFIPSNIEPFCWLAIFLFCAYMIARNTATSRFLHGLCLGLANCVWITAAHVSRHDDHTGLRRKRLFALRAPLDRTHRCDRCANVARKLVARVVQSKMKVLGAAV